MDSRQVYRGLDIGTAKPSPEEQRVVPHHNLDVLDPGDRYGAGEFARDARRWIAEIRARGRVPILAGGTGFFLRTLTHPIFEEPRLEPERTRALGKLLASLGREELRRWVARLDPKRAAVAAQGGPQRMIRALAVALLSGRPISWWHREQPAKEAPLEGVCVLLLLPARLLAARIAKRTRAMIEGGLVEEAKALRAAGWTRSAPAMNAVGYPEIFDYIEGKCGLGEATRRIEAATRRYARRQRTWFRHKLPPGAIRVDATLGIDEQLRIVTRALRRPPAPA